LEKTDDRRILNSDSAKVNGTHDGVSHVNGTHVNGTSSTKAGLNNTPKVASESTTNLDVPRFFPFSAKDENAAKAQATVFAEYLSTHPWKNHESESQWLADLSYTLRCRRNRFDHQFAIPAASVSDLMDNLSPIPQTGRRLQTYKSVFVMTGQGSQWAGMAASVMSFPVFAEAMHRADQCLKQMGCEWSLLGMTVAKLQRFSHADCPFRRRTPQTCRVF
jgi:acyl transferase domain-containing protein